MPTKISILPPVQNTERVILVLAGSALLQDPIRKALPGQPAYWLLLFLFPAVVGLTGFSGTAFIDVLKNRTRFGRVRMIMGLILISSSIARIWPDPSLQNVKTMQLGLIAPFCGVVGFFWGGLFFDRVRPETQQSTVRWLGVIIGLFCVGTVFELVASHDHTISWLGPMPPYRPWYRTIGADRFRMLCGFFRSPETAGWFSAMLLPLVGVIAAMTPIPKICPLRWTALGAFAVFVCLMAGRRKMQLMMILAAMILSGLLRWSGYKTEARQSARVMLLSVCLGCLTVAFVPKAELYLGYFSTSPVKAPMRTLESTLVPIMSTATEISWFGRGLGEMAPGRQHVVGESLMYAEGGLVRVFVETGWIGLAAFVVIVLTLISRCLTPFQVDSSCHRGEQGSADVVMRAGATAAILASLFAFLIGHQVFGDPVVMFVTGCTLAVALPCVKRGPEQCHQG